MTAVFGRERELALADSFIESAGGHFGLLLLEGEAGIGKTTVWREIVRRAGNSGTAVLACRPAETEAKLALAAIADLLDGVPEEAFATLPGIQRRALDIALLRAEPDGSAPPQRTLGSALRSLLAGLSRDRPLLVAIDDVQWLDAGSALVLEFALRRLWDMPVRCLFAVRTTERSRLAAEAVAPPESVTRATLGPLTLAALHHVLRERFEHRFTRPQLLRIHRASAGNPLYALEIAREAGRDGGLAATGNELPVPDDVRQIVSTRLRRLPADTRETLLAAAALSAPTTSLVDERALRPAEEDGIVGIDGEGRIAFRHPLYASAVYESSSRPRRRELHRRLAQLVGDPEEQARHLALAATGPDEGVARRLEAGAAVARSRGAWESAAELLERARSLTPPATPDAGRRRGIEAAHHHIHAGDRVGARALLERLLGEPLPRTLRAYALLLLAEISYHDDRGAEMVQLYAEAREYADEPRVAAAIEIALSWLYPGGASDIEGGVPHATRALEYAQASGDDALVASALAVCALLEFMTGRGHDLALVERSLALEDHDVVVPIMWRPSATAACLDLWAGRLGAARERFTSVATAARERGDESDFPFLLLWQSFLETRSGDFAAATALAEEMADFAALTGSRTFHAFMLAQRALIRAHVGPVAETRRDCAEAAALAVEIGNPQPLMWVAAALAVLELSLGDPGAAWRACEPITEPIEQAGVGEPIWAIFLPDALEALIALGRLERAEALLDSFEERGRTLDRAWVIATAGRCRGLLRAARSDLDGAAAALELALGEYARHGMPFEHARTLLVSGAVERRMRRRARARESIEQARAIFDRLGATRWVERARAEHGRLGLRRTDGDALTESEQRVAELAARGLTNREVAAALFVSPKTVEANLARVYRKLGIASRAELGALKGDRAQT